MSAYHPLYI